MAENIRLNLNNIAFYSKDSLFKIAVESFTLFNKDVIFNQVSYGPVAPNVTASQLTFTAPFLRLRNISLEDLLRKRLIATDAKLVQPFINVSAIKTPRPDTDNATVNSDKKADMYQTIHELAELLQVKTLHIVDANAHYTLAAKMPVRVDLKNLNTTIHLRKLLLSDSLVDMMHATPTLTIGQVSVAANNTNVLINQFAFNEKKQCNKAGKFRLKAANGMRLTGEKLSLKLFDWNVFQKTKRMQIEQLRLGTLAIDANVENSRNTTLSTHMSMTSMATATINKPLPHLQIGQILVDQLQMKAALSNHTSVGFVGEGIRIDKLITDAHLFRWRQFGGKLSNLYYNQPLLGDIG
ncbi:MAG: hypothetical protein EOO88_59605, partial [Pedobacter sp.]